MSFVPRTASVFNVPDSTGTLFPVIVADDTNGTPRVMLEATGFLRDIHGTLGTKRAAATVLAFLNDYAVTVLKGKPLMPWQLVEAVRGFIHLRRFGDSDHSHGLGWPPLKMSTVRRDMRILSMYSEYCSKNFQQFKIVNVDGHGPSEHRSFADSFRKGRSALLRNRPSSGKPLIYGMGALPEKPVLTGGRPKPVLTLPQVLAIIEATPGKAMKAAFLLASFGGIRSSEMLNIWTTDLLPGRHRKKLFPTDANSNVPLVVLAHPSQSTFISLNASTGQDRCQHLAKTGAKPRNLLQGHPLHAGWKGMLYDNHEQLISQVYWSNPDMAVRFDRLAMESRASVILGGGLKALESHPFLLVNDTPHKLEIGLPMKMSNLQKAFERAMRKAGVDTELHGKGIHSLRHFYKATLEDLGITREYRRIAMHHVSIASQNSYAVSAERTNLAISFALKGKESP